MKSSWLSFLVIPLLWLSLGVATAADAPSDTPSLVGRKIGNFSLKDYRGKATSLDDFKDSPLIVVAFLGTECPLAKLYAPRLNQLANEYESKGVSFLAINPNRQDSISELEAFARRHGVEFPVLKDPGNIVADQMGARRTPEVFVLDQDRIVRYHGRVDDRYGIGYIRDQANREDLSIALDQLLAGEPVTKSETDVVGCLIGRIHEPNSKGTVTYSNQISRLFQKRCVECHREGDIAPFSLTHYEDVVGWADMIDEVVHQRRMPPWHANPEFGTFSDDRSLSDDELNLIRKWVADGAPEGDPSELPEPRTYTQGWQLPREPDQVVAMSDEPFSVPAEGTVRYQFFTVDPGFTEDKWVTSAEILPGNRSVVHHILVFVVDKNGSRRPEALRSFLVGYVPGLRARSYPDGMAKRIPAGSELAFQVHYTPTGTAQEDLSKVGFIFADPDTVKMEVKTTSAVQPRFLIPPYADNHPVEALSPTIPDDALLISLMPHMHLRGKSARAALVTSDEGDRVLLDVPHYDFNWQTAYVLEKPLAIPAGSKVHATAHFDNSEHNLANPDPSAAVRWGSQTWEEMWICYFDIAVPVDPHAIQKEQPSVSREVLASRRGARLFALWDSNGDRKLSEDEVPTRYRRLIDRFDRNGDQSLESDELGELFRRLP